MARPTETPAIARLGERRVEHAALAELVLQPVGHAEDAAELPDVLAEEEHPVVLGQRVAERLVQRLGHRDLSHRAVDLVALPRQLRRQVGVHPREQLRQRPRLQRHHALAGPRRERLRLRVHRVQERLVGQPVRSEAAPEPVPGDRRRATACSCPPAGTARRRRRWSAAAIR